MKLPWQRMGSSMATSINQWILFGSLLTCLASRSNRHPTRYREVEKTFQMCWFLPSWLQNRTPSLSESQATPEGNNIWEMF